MARSLTARIAALLLLFAFLSPMPHTHALAPREQKVFGQLVRRGKVLVLQTDDADYIVAGRDLNRLEGKMVEITGTVIENRQGDTILVKTAREIDE